MGVFTKLSLLVILTLAILIYLKLNKVPPLPVLEEKWWGLGLAHKQETTIIPFKIDISSEVITQIIHFDHENSTKNEGFTRPKKTTRAYFALSASFGRGESTLRHQHQAFGYCGRLLEKSVQLDSKTRTFKRETSLYHKHSGIFQFIKIETRK